MSPTALCAYAITTDHAPDLSGTPAVSFEVEPRLIAYLGVALVVAEVDVDRFAGLGIEPAEDGRLARLAREHDAVVRAVFRCAPVLPLRFGTVITDSDAALLLLRAHHEEARVWLDRVQGRREWGVRGRGSRIDDTTVPGEVDLANVSGTQYLALRRQQLTGVEDARRGRIAAIRTLHGELSRRAAESTSRDHPGDLLLDAAYLVDTTAEADFHAEVRRLSDELGPRGVSVEVTGPWPPYSFTQIEFAVAGVVANG
ncbi:hypothetical protein ALI22I_08950 [Saccharothrix sp. ALI-22-I]|uniref:GvpL/GvpF family gas vesicle protein n=1 Tax=Saccharothrix sp. ALI-22-I TaxID=1933778 RepID=UPI00097BDDEE|nr:GvpL/GvpF family gas vesicle protein [Saccharothrix sp. ALI-22-I]ONI91459.1 hypothetical protein ALI22I_08950 [Saccharothrix sp. ALI-22-I]